MLLTVRFWLGVLLAVWMTPALPSGGAECYYAQDCPDQADDQGAQRQWRPGWSVGAVCTGRIGQHGC